MDTDKGADRSCMFVENTISGNAKAPFGNHYISPTPAKVHQGDSSYTLPDGVKPLQLLGIDVQNIDLDDWGYLDTFFAAAHDRREAHNVIPRQTQALIITKHDGEKLLSYIGVSDSEKILDSCSKLFTGLAKTLTTISQADREYLTRNTTCALFVAEIRDLDLILVLGQALNVDPIFFIQHFKGDETQSSNDRSGWHANFNFASNDARVKGATDDHRTRNSVRISCLKLHNRGGVQSSNDFRWILPSSLTSLLDLILLRKTSAPASIVRLRIITETDKDFNTLNAMQDFLKDERHIKLLNCMDASYPSESEEKLLEALQAFFWKVYIDHLDTKVGPLSETASPASGPETIEALDLQRRTLIEARRRIRGRNDTIRPSIVDFLQNGGEIDEQVITGPLFHGYDEVEAKISDVLQDLHENFQTHIATIQWKEAKLGMNLAKETQRQADRATMLTLLAAIYLPLTLATGIFGMNIDLIAAEPGPRWWWVIIVTAIFLAPTITFAMYFFADKKWKNLIKGARWRQILTSRPEDSMTKSLPRVESTTVQQIRTAREPKPVGRVNTTQLESQDTSDDRS